MCKDATYMFVGAQLLLDLRLRHHRVACKAWVVVHSIENSVWTKTVDLNGVVNERNDLVLATAL